MYYLSKSAGIHRLQCHLAISPVGEDSLLSFHRRLIEIPSISGHEHEVSIYLEQYLKARNFTVEKQEVDPIQTGAKEADRLQRFNLLAYPGASRSTRVLLSTHLDTVPPYLPYELRENEQIWGRGSVDAKACVATQIKAVEELLASDDVSAGDVALLFVVGEEIGGDGMKRANDLGLTWETVIFGEPTELKLASGHKGLTTFTIDAAGQAGHSGYPWLGESAISMLLPALLALETLTLPSSEKYGNSTLNIGRVEGGVAANVIAGNAQAEILIRIADGTPDQIQNVVAEAMRSVDDRLKLQTVTQGYGPIDMDSDVEGFASITVNYGTDIPNLRGTHKRYLYGPGSILVAHSDHEHLAAGDLSLAVEGYKTLVLSALSKH